MKQDGQPGRSCSVHRPAWHGSSVRDQISTGANLVRTREMTVNSSPRSSQTSAPNTPIASRWTIT